MAEQYYYLYFCEYSVRVISSFYLRSFISNTRYISSIDLSPLIIKDTRCGKVINAHYEILIIHECKCTQ